MIASNEDWVVPASSRRPPLVSRSSVTDEREKDYAYFARNRRRDADTGGLAAMLYDLLQQPDSCRRPVNVRSAPVDAIGWSSSGLHSYDNKRRWWRGVLLEGGLRDNESGTFVALDEEKSTAARREEVFLSARPYFLGPRNVDPTPSEVGQFISKMLGNSPKRARPSTASAPGALSFRPSKRCANAG